MAILFPFENNYLIWRGHHMALKDEMFLKLLAMIKHFYCSGYTVMKNISLPMKITESVKSWSNLPET